MGGGRLGVFEKRAVWGIFGLSWVKVARGWREI
jgi:hypothetical protein